MGRRNGKVSNAFGIRMSVPLTRAFEQTLLSKTQALFISVVSRPTSDLPAAKFLFPLHGVLESTTVFAAQAAS